VVDVTWATSQLYQKIHDWRVAEDVETLSDHLYILMEVALGVTNDTRRRGMTRTCLPPRWRLKGRNKEMLRAAAIVSAWIWDARSETMLRSIDKEAEDLHRFVCAVNAIQRLGLSVSPAKSETLWFFNRRRRGTTPPGLSVAINGVYVPVRCEMKYLGLTIDSHWTFGPHLELLVPRVTVAANALCVLLPNIGGAGMEVRRPYGGVARSESSMGLLYGPKT
jgi:hypothetical protein